MTSEGRRGARQSEQGGIHMRQIAWAAVGAERGQEVVRRQSGNVAGGQELQGSRQVRVGVERCGVGRGWAAMSLIVGARQDLKRDEIVAGTRS